MRSSEGHFHHSVDLPELCSIEHGHASHQETDEVESCDDHLKWSRAVRRSGYGLDVDNERKMLQVARQIGEQRDIRVVKTFIGAHAVPAEFTDDAVSISA